MLARLALLLVLLLPTWPVSAQPDGGETFEVDRLAIETQAGNRYDFTVELAITRAQQAQGLMFRESMALDAGMLFVFPEVRPASFWMENTLIPLDMLFVRDDGTIARIAANTTPLSRESVPSGEPVRAVLEINGGLSAMLGIRPGDRVLHAAFGTGEVGPASPSAATAPGTAGRPPG